MARRDSGRRARMLGIAIGLLAVLLLAGGAAAILLGGLGPGPSPSELAVLSPSPPPTLAPTEEPTLAPTEEPTAEPTEQPTAEPPPTPPPGPDCSTSTVPTSWVNLSGAETHARVRRGEYWCIHQVIVVPDPNFGEGRIRLRVGDEVLTEVNHAPGGPAEYPFSFAPAELVPPRTDVDYRMRCATDVCNAVIQVGYERYELP